jgi:hypothetical protein
MKVTNLTRKALRYRRQLRDKTKAGWLHIDQHHLLMRGAEYDQRVVAVEIGVDGQSLYVKCEPPSP